MKTNDVIAVLSSIPIGSIMAWTTVIFGIIAAICAGTIRLYKLFEKTHEMKEENEEFIELVKSHDSQLKSIQESINTIQTTLDRHEKSEMKKLRYNLIRGMEEYVSKGEITIRQLMSLEESFEDYHAHNGNGYVTTMMRKVRALPVKGKLDEEGNDIDETQSI